MKHTKRNVKRLVPLVLGLVFMSMLIGAATFNYFAEFQATATVNAFIEYSDDGGSTWQSAENLNIVIAETFLGGDSYSKDFKLRLNSGASDNVTLYFNTTISPDDVGITATIDGDGVTGDGVVLDPGVAADLVFEIITEPRLKSDVYTIVLNLNDVL